MIEHRYTYSVIVDDLTPIQRYDLDCLFRDALYEAYKNVFSGDQRVHGGAAIKVEHLLVD